MPIKWKIFLALNFILGLPAFILLVFLVIKYSHTGHSSEDYLIFWIFTFALSVMIINSLLNISLLQRFYPDKLLPPVFKRLHMMFSILSGIIAAGMCIVCVYGALEMSNTDTRIKSRGWIVLSIFFVTMIIQVITLVMQVQLPRRVTRNGRNSMRSLIDSIGQ